MNIHDKIADAFASFDELAEDVREALWDRLLLLLNTPKVRVEGIWNQAEAPIDITVASLMSIPNVQRNKEWCDTYAAMIAAAKEQAFIEVIAYPMLSKMEKHTKRVVGSAKEATVTELKQAAKDGVPRETFNKAKAARQQRTAVA